MTIEQRVEAQLRIMRRRPTAKKFAYWKWVLFLVVLAFVVRVTTGGAAQKAFAAAFVGVAMIVLYRLGVRRFRRELRNELVERSGTDQPIPIKFGISEAGLTVKMPDVESTFHWDAIQAVLQVDDRIELWTSRGGLILIDDSDFRDVEQRERWIRLCRQWAALSPQCFGRGR